MTHEADILCAEVGQAFVIGVEWSSPVCPAQKWHHVHFHRRLHVHIDRQIETRCDASDEAGGDGLSSELPLQGL
eukprot:SAG31_NODE_19345_length_605_cov_0.913043_2_plen_73_part_01